MRTMRILALGLGLAAVAWLALRESDDADRPHRAASPTAEGFDGATGGAASPAPVVEQVDDIASPPHPAAVAGTVRLPDGTVRAALNGVVGAPALNWPIGKPYAPIVEVRRLPDGFDWFVHADGTMSTTRYMFRPELGRDDATTIRFDPDQDAARLRPETSGSALGAQPVDR